MFRTLVPIFALIVAVALFFTYVRPTFEEVRAVQDETHEYREAVVKAEELQQRIDELKAQRNDISLTDLERLEALLPDSIDEVLLLIDIDNLAKENEVVLGNIRITGEGAAGGGDIASRFSSSEIPEGADTAPYKSLDVAFSVSGSYESFRSFLTELERSLVLTDIVQIEFTNEEDDFIDAVLRARFYSLNNPS